MATKAPKKSAKKTAKKTASKKIVAKTVKSNTKEDLGDWREETLARMRVLILEADPRMTEERKWKKPSNGMVGVPVWSHNGIVCTGETYKAVVKLTFAHGAKLPDPSQLFNASLEGGTRRAIDIREGEKVDARAFKALVKAAVAFNGASKIPAKSKAAKAPALLSGGNPQIAKADGDAPVQAYIAAMPGWKREVGRKLDKIIMSSAPKAHKAVKWNSPFYGIEGRGWFLSFHVFTRYVKVTFFNGGSLKPIPPGESKNKGVRYLDIHEDDQLNEAQFTKWVKQASKLPGWTP
ncbi:MAG: DUF1801 domain-containing protein [bacterium]|nr:DUF1801 domain-containing protein [bacterium]